VIFIYKTSFEGPDNLRNLDIQVNKLYRKMNQFKFMLRIVNNQTCIFGVARRRLEYLIPLKPTDKLGCLKICHVCLMFCPGPSINEWNKFYINLYTIHNVFNITSGWPSQGSIYNKPFSMSYSIVDLHAGDDN